MNLNSLGRYMQLHNQPGSGTGGGPVARSGQVDRAKARGRDPHILAAYMDGMADAVDQGFRLGVLPEGAARRALESLTSRDVLDAADEILAGIEVAHESQFDMASGALTDTLATFAAPTVALLKQALRDPDAVVTTGRGALDKVSQLTQRADSLLSIFDKPEKPEKSEEAEGAEEAAPRRARRQAKRSRDVGVDEPAEQEEVVEDVRGFANVCPECGEDSQGRCRCAIGESTCQNNHKWITCSVHDRQIAIPFDAETHGIGLDSRPSRCLCDVRERLQAPSPPRRLVRPDPALGRELIPNRGAVRAQVATGALDSAQAGSLRGWQNRRAPAAFRDPNVLIDTDGLAARL